AGVLAVVEGGERDLRVFLLLRRVLVGAADRLGEGRQGDRPQVVGGDQQAEEIGRAAGRDPV
ncbi:hypothetical protein QVM39_32985, partial [Pseudomonas aeruginosa]|uniref:hypothetical protein n=1 Tax=Pseudomonas aeruginosa TaxID=287 RepID=UPI00352551B4